MTPIEHEQVDIQPMTAKSRLTIIFTWTISVLVLVLYAWAIVNAVGNFVGLRGFARSLESDLTMSGWFWLLGGILLPIVIAVLAFFLARKQPEKRWLVLLVGLALVALLQLNVQHLVPQSSFFGL
ncbi:MAG: hypothetical protein ACTHZM_03130 [Canibacter sp.]